MNRRKFLALVGLGLGSLHTASAMAQAVFPGASLGSNKALVQLVNFQCSRCRAVNDHHALLKKTAEDAGYAFRVAPLAWPHQSIWPDRVFYAVRNLYPNAEDLVRDAIFDGIQREGQRFEELPQMLAYLERGQRMRQILALEPTFSPVAVADYAASDETLVSEGKAIRLAVLSGAQEVPVFLWIHDGEVTQVLSPAEAPEPIQLVQGVLRSFKRTQVSDQR